MSRLGHGESGGNPTVDMAAANPPPPGREVERVHVLICKHANGGESIYGQMLGSLMVNFVTEDDRRKEQLHQLLTRQGTYTVAPKLGVELEWRTYEKT